MTHSTLKIFSSTSDQDNVSIRMITFSITSIVLILVVVFFIKTYVNQKQNILNTMHVEGEMMEAFCSENINHIWYVINLLAAQIKKHPNEPNYIKNIFKDYIGNKDTLDIFGWTEFIWVDKNLKNMISSNNTAVPKDLIKLTHNVLENKIVYFADTKHNELYAITGINNTMNNAYSGTVIIKFDILNIVRRLNNHKKHNYTNVAVIGVNNEVVVQSTANMQSLGIQNKQIVNPELNKAISTIGFDNAGNKKTLSFLDVITGNNYYLQKVNELPFIILINIDDREIRHNILHSVITKFIETSIIASCFLLLVIFVYKREAWLRKQAEIASEIANRATDAKSDFLAFTAHEIRSPLGFIITGSEMMSKELLGPLPSGYKDYVDGINKNAALILKFITDILDESHIMTGAFKIISKPVNIKTIIDNSVTLNIAKCHKKNITLDIQITPDLPKLMCDSTRILQVMNNLISNAIQYSFNNTTITILVTLQHDRICIEVIDRGVGMTEDELSVAFAKYGTVRREHFDFIESYGLGLPIVKMILDAHKATLIVETTVDVGTHFKIFFPASSTLIDKNNKE